MCRVTSPDAPVQVYIYNPEWDTAKWSEYSNLDNIQLLWRRVGDVDWHNALDETLNRVYFATSVPAVGAVVIKKSTHRTVYAVPLVDRR